VKAHEGKEEFRLNGSSLGRLDETAMMPVAFPLWSDAVVSAVTEVFKISKKDLLGKSRRRKYAWPRQVGAALDYQFGQSAAAAVGDTYGGRNYSWVYWSRATVSKAMGRSELTTGQVQAVYNLAAARYLKK
jgi:hypothetical protein